MTYRIEQSGASITSMDDWLRLAPPKRGQFQWKDGRSAKEAARRWLAGYPSEVRRALDSHPHLAGFEPTVVEPEYETELDEFFQARNHDLVVEGSTDNDRVLVCVEAKADESFDQPVGTKLRSLPEGSNLPERVRRIALGLFGHSDVTKVATLPYQLLQATAATLIEADHRGVDRCVFLVHVFETDATDPQRLRRNAGNLNAFVERISQGHLTKLGDDQAVGPIFVPGYDRIPSDKTLYVGKAVARLRTDLGKPK